MFLSFIVSLEASLKKAKILFIELVPASKSDIRAVISLKGFVKIFVYIKNVDTLPIEILLFKAKIHPNSTNNYIRNIRYKSSRWISKRRKEV